MTKRPGRPSLDPADTTMRLSLSLPAKRYDALSRTAAAERTTVSDWLRRAVTRELLLRKLPSPRP